MLKFVFRRLLLAVVTAIVVACIVFSLSRTAGDPRLLYLSEYTTKETWDEWGRQMGLDRPLLTQFIIWLGKVLRGDLGTSLRGEAPVSLTLVRSLKVTAQLALAAWLFTVSLGVPLGVLSAVKRGTVFDYLGRAVAMFGQALP
ncbi:MAG: ABC transporter permease, partial [Chloroflexota bacterium]|nr:ABC transporter permease [Chloroflexota bacterium]